MLFSSSLAGASESTFTVPTSLPTSVYVVSTISLSAILIEKFHTIISSKYSIKRKAILPVYAHLHYEAIPSDQISPNILSLVTSLKFQDL